MENANYNKDQVFISFRGKDERYSFLTHLKEKLKAAKVNVFTDEDNTGKPLADLLEEIRRSRIVIVLFTENFANSNDCLDELVEITKCIASKQLKAVLPVFFTVTATSVKEQSGTFGKVFTDYQKSLLDEAGDDEEKKKDVNSRIEGWKNALKVFAGIVGMSYIPKTSEAEFAKKIVDKVTKNLGQIAEPTTEISHAQPPNINTFNFYVSQLNINNQLHDSTTLQGLDLFINQNILESYRKLSVMSQILKPPLSNFTPYVEKPSDSQTSDPNVPQEIPHPAYGRAMFLIDKIKQRYPWIFNIFPKENKGQNSLANIDPRRYENGGTNRVSSLSYYAKRWFCLSSGAQK